MYINMYMVPQFPINVSRNIVAKKNSLIRIFLKVLYLF